MIVNIEQRPEKLIISYINSEGDIKFQQFNIPVSHQYNYVYAKQRAGSDPQVMSWDFKPVRKVPSRFLTKYRIQEFFCDAGDALTKNIFEMNMPKLYSCDIEVDVDDNGFAEAADANNRINTISWSHYPDVTVFGLKPLSGEECNDIENNIEAHLKPINKKYNFYYKQHISESEMLYDFLYNYARHASLITGWFFWSFDWQYIFNRCRKLNIDISWMSPTKQWYKYKIVDKNKESFIMLPQHKLIVDYMAIYKKWDTTVFIKENNSLDFAAEAVLNIKKVKYAGTFKDLYKDFAKYVFYNAIDSILVEEIHHKINTLRIFLGLSNINRVEAMDAFSPIRMLESTATRYIYKRNQIFPKKENLNEREGYEGAFVFKPEPNLYEWLGAFDYASLYPSIMRQFKISIENFVIKDKNYVVKPHEIKCSSGAVFDNSKEPLLPEILTDYYVMRKEAQNKYKVVEMELNELKNILKNRQTESQLK
jgi:DNA polymerase elongation subunit (family B)